MKHLTDEQIEAFAEGQAAALAAHVDACAQCKQQVLREQRLIRALAAQERAVPSREFVARLGDRLTLEMNPGPAAPLSPGLVGFAAAFAAVLLLVFVYQTMLAFQQSGAADFLSLFISRPDLLRLDPYDAVSALLESLPLLELVFTFGLFIIALVLTREFAEARSAAGRRMNQGR